jgi:hypothetical protein
MGSIHEKKQGPKISCYCTFKFAVKIGRYVKRHGKVVLNNDICYVC